MSTARLEVYAAAGGPVPVGIANYPPHIVNHCAGAGIADYWIRIHQPCQQVTLGFRNPDQRTAICQYTLKSVHISESIFEISGAARTVTLPAPPAGQRVGLIYIRRKSLTSQHPYPCNVIIDNVWITP